MNSYFLLILLVPLATCFNSHKAIDLTHPVGEHTIAWPTATKFSTDKVVAEQLGVEGEGGHWYESRDIIQSEHSGTHMDAPAHFCKEGWHTSDIPLERLAGPGVKISIEERVVTNLDTGLTVEDIEAWEEEFGEIPDEAIVIVHTGHGRLYNDREKYFGRPADLKLAENDTEHLHFPGVDPEAAEWLVANRNIVGLGTDTPSTDRGQSKKFRTHQVLCKENIWGLENLARTEELPSTGFMVYNMVHKLEGGSGGPSRVVAVLDMKSSVKRSVASGVGTYLGSCILVSLVLPRVW